MAEKKKTNTTAKKVSATKKPSTTKKTVASATKSKASNTRKTGTTTRNTAVKSRRISPIAIIAGILGLIAIAAIALFLFMGQGKTWTEKDYQAIAENKTTLVSVEEEFGKAKESIPYHVAGKNITFKIYDNVYKNQAIILTVDENNGKIYQKEISKKTEFDDDKYVESFNKGFTSEFEKEYDGDYKITGDLGGPGHIKINSNKWTKEKFDSTKTDENVLVSRLMGSNSSGNVNAVSYKEVVKKFGKPYAYVETEVEGTKIISALWGNTNGNIESQIVIGFAGNPDDDLLDFQAFTKTQTGLK